MSDINPFNNLLFPFIVSFTGLFLALKVQKCNQVNNDLIKQNQYLTSLKSDLLKDISNFDKVTALINTTVAGLDTALEQMQIPITDLRSVELNYISIMKYDWFPPRANFSEGTISQLMSTGNLTLIRDQELADSIAVYYIGINLCNKDAELVVDAYKETFTTQKLVYNYRDRIAFQQKLGVSSSRELQNMSNEYLLELMNDSIRMASKDPAKIIACYNDFANYQAALKLYCLSLSRQRTATDDLLTLISKKANL